MRRVSATQATCVALASAAVLAISGCGSDEPKTASTGTRMAAGGDAESGRRSFEPIPCPEASYAKDMAMIIENRIPGVTVNVYTSNIPMCGTRWSGPGNYTLLRGRLDNRKKLVPMTPVDGTSPEFSIVLGKAPGGYPDGVPPNGNPIATVDVKLTQYLGSPASIQSRPSGTSEWITDGSYVAGSVDGRKVRALTGVVKNPGNGSWTAAPKAKAAWSIAFQYAN